MALYADVNGKQFPVTRGQDVGRYQVRINMIPAGQYLSFCEILEFNFYGISEVITILPWFAALISLLKI